MINVRNKEDLLKQLPLHYKWLNDEEGGERLICSICANLSGANLIGADLRRANLIGADLSDADLIGADLSGANLIGADLSDADLSGANLSGADLRRANLRRANLSGADLRRANLRRADLSGANLRRANLHGLEVPVIESVHQAVLSAVEQDGHSLKMDSWHTCDTTHCRAGWVTTLAGEKGKALEDQFGTGVAATLIYFASDPTMEIVPNWLDSNEGAMDDIRRMAQIQAQEKS